MLFLLSPPLGCFHLTYQVNNTWQVFVNFLGLFTLWWAFGIRTLSVSEVRRLCINGRFPKKLEERSYRELLQEVDCRHDRENPTATLAPVDSVGETILIYGNLDYGKIKEKEIFNGARFAGQESCMSVSNAAWCSFLRSVVAIGKMRSIQWGHQGSMKLGME